MAARINPAIDAEHRSRIQTTQLIKRLQSFAFAEEGVEIDPSRLKAIEILLRKALPDLSNVALTGEDNKGPAKMLFGWLTKPE